VDRHRRRRSPSSTGACLRADEAGSFPWSLPLTARRLDDLIAVGLDACLLVTAAISGMRSGELMEIIPGSCLPPRRVGARRGRGQH
jgi:hypothetical protein